MYYTQNRDKVVTLHVHRHRGSYDSSSKQVIFSDDYHERAVTRRIATVYSYRSRRPRDAASTPTYGENLIKRGSSITAYNASYRAAVDALQTEAESTATASGHSGRGLYDSGHSFYVRKTPAKVGTFTEYVRHQRSDVRWTDVLKGEFVVFPGWFELKNLAQGEHVDTATANVVQRLASATVPDRIRGSLGQDLVDLAQLPKFVSSLSRMARDLPLLAEQWSRLSHRARAAIDYAFRHPGKASKAVARRAGSGYLEWLFVLKPYVDDMRLIADFLCRGSAQLLTRMTYTRDAPVSERRFETETQGNYLDLLYAPVRMRSNVTVKRTVHVAVGWLAKGVTSSDEYFLTKARSLNRALGLWYPSLLWDLAPWTWLLDWCLHFGDTIDNATAIHESGYNPIYSWATVRETSVTHYSLKPFYTSDCWLDGEHPGTVSGYVLTRYPFDVNGVQMPSFEGLSSTQRGILTALGFSHLKH